MTMIKDLFSAFEPGLLDELESDTEIREVPANTVLMYPGQYIRSTLLVLDGLIKVFREDEEGNEFFMYHLEPGDACALSMTCMVAQEKSTISAKTVNDTSVLMVPIDKMESWMNKYKSWYHFVIQTYRNRFDDLLHTLDNVAFRNMDERLEFYLKKHAESMHTKQILITHQQIAQELNSSREVISRLLKKLAERGKIRVHRNEIEILNL